MGGSLEALIIYSEVFEKDLEDMVDSFFFRNASGDSEEDGSKQDIYKKCAI